MIFLPYRKQIGDLVFTNFYMDDGIPKPVQNHLDYTPFSFFQISKLLPNSYYGTEDQYEWEGDRAVCKNEYGGVYRIDRSCFVNPTTQIVIAMWSSVNRDSSHELRFVESRAFELDEQEQKDFWELAKHGNEYIQNLFKEE